jgi:hypothetical protein
MQAITMAAAVDWNGVGYWVFVHVRAAMETVLTGVGIGFVTFLRHAPSSRKDSVWTGCLFDTFQVLVSNESCIGERRAEDNSGVVQEPTPEPPRSDVRAKIPCSGRRCCLAGGDNRWSAL